MYMKWRIRKPLSKFYDTSVEGLFKAMDVELHLKSNTKKLGHEFYRLSRPLPVKNKKIFQYKTCNGSSCREQAWEEDVVIQRELEVSLG